MEETKKNASRQGIAPEANRRNIMRAKEEEDLKYLYNLPNGFEINDEEMIKFFERMEALRSRREILQREEEKRRKKELEEQKEGRTTTETAQETPEEKAIREKEEKEREDLLIELENKKWTRKECALAIGVSEAMLSKYTTGKVKRISRQRMEAICQYFSTTPHYLFGISTKYDNVVEIDRLGNIVYNKDGKPNELKHGFISYPIIPEDAVKRYEMLYHEHPTMFWIIQRIISVTEPRRKKIEIILEQLVDL